MTRLVLARKKREKVRIDHDIVIEILDIRSEVVRLRIEAPRDRIIHREEVYNAIHRKESE